MAEPQITMYRTRTCPYCIGAEQLLRAKGVTFEQVYLDDRPDRREFLAGIKPGHKTVPLVVAGGEPLGGFDDLQALEAAGELDRKLRGG
jgi:glutaredoxin 3